MTRATVSIVSNIAEGAERASSADSNRFLNIDTGSAEELRTQVYIAARIGTLTAEQQSSYITDLNNSPPFVHTQRKASGLKASPTGVRVILGFS